MSEPIRSPLPTRRQIIRRGFAGTLLLLVAGGAGSALWPTRRRKPRSGLRVFDEREASILSAVAAAVLRVEPGAPSAEDVDVAGRIDGLLALSSAEVQGEFRQLVRLFENGFTGILTGTGWTSFTAASEKSRQARLSAWELSRLPLFRTGYQAMKRLCTACYYSSPASWASIGYPGPPEIAS
jgi:hypothetical protein